MVPTSTGAHKAAGNTIRIMNLIIRTSINHHIQVTRGGVKYDGKNEAPCKNSSIKERTEDNKRR